MGTAERLQLLHERLDREAIMDEMPDLDIVTVVWDRAYSCIPKEAVNLVDPNDSYGMQYHISCQDIQESIHAQTGDNPEDDTQSHSGRLPPQIKISKNKLHQIRRLENNNHEASRYRLMYVDGDKPVELKNGDLIIRKMRVVTGDKERYEIMIIISNCKGYRLTNTSLVKEIMTLTDVESSQ